MLRRRESLAQGEKSMANKSIKKIEVVVPMALTQILVTNYRHWAMRMEVHLDAQGLKEVVARTERNRSKDRLALFAMLAEILETYGVR